jgi:membrane protease YdiL (CAAX protease family)
MARRFPNLNSDALATLALLAGLAFATAIRLLVGGPGAGRSPWAGLVFAAGLAALSFAAGTRGRLSRRAVAVGAAGGLALCLPAVIVRLFHHPGGLGWTGYPAWALTIAIVATTEEYFFRGALFDNSGRWLGQTGAVLLPAAAFALMHVPFYGWRVLPLDLAVGVWLGALRLVARSWTAPAVAHTSADLVSWWLV